VTIASSMKPAERRHEILRQLSDRGEVTFAELAANFGVSEMTVRRDVEHLSLGGHLRGVRGGAISVTSRSYEPPFAFRQASAGAAKVAIGQAAAALVNDGDTLFIDVGTTALELARALRARPRLTVVTASLRVAVELGSVVNIRVVLTGGEVRAGELSLTGGMAEDAFASLNCDLAFIGVAGVAAVPGATDFNPDDARVKRAAIGAARRRIILADASKLGKVFFATIGPITDFDALVTNAPRSDATLRAAEAAGVEIVRVDVNREVLAVPESSCPSIGASGEGASP